MHILGVFNATAGSPRFNEICDMLHENNVMFRDTVILPDSTYTHDNNGSQTCCRIKLTKVSRFVALNLKII